MGSIAQALQDKDFLSAHPDDQKAYLSSIDKDFAAASPGDQSAYLNHILGPHVKAINAQPTQFEKENARPYLENLGMREPGTAMQPQEYFGLPNTRLMKEAGKGALSLAKGTGGLIGDLLTGQVDPATGEIAKHGIGGLVGENTKGEFAPIERARAITNKYITDPAVAEYKKGEQEGGVAGAGHKAAAAIPLLGPWAAELGERAGTGDVGGAGAEATGQVGLGELAPKIPEVAKKVGTKALEMTGHPAGFGATGPEMITKAVRPRARAQGWDEAVNSPGVQREIQNYNAQTPIKDLSDLKDAIPSIKEKIWNEKIQPAVDRKAHLPIDMKPVSENIRAAITPEMREFDPGSAKQLEELADKMSGVRDVQAVNPLLKYVNGQLQTYFGKYPAMRYGERLKNPEIAGWEAARGAIRDQLLGTMEKAGESQIRDARQDYGHFRTLENEVERKTNVADRRSLIPLYRALGILGAPFTHGLTLAAGEAMTHFNSPESLLQRGIGKLNPPAEAPFTPPTPFKPQYDFAIGPQKSEFAEPLGPQPAPKPFDVSGENQPNRTGLWDKDNTFRQIGQLPGAGFGEPYTPRERFEPIQGEQQRLNLPGAEHELFNLPQTPGKVPAPEPAAPAPFGGPGRQGIIGRIGEARPTEQVPVPVRAAKEAPRATEAPATREEAPPAAKATLEPNQSTYDKYYNKETNEWAPERQEIHDRVAAEAVKGKTFPKDRPPEAIITVGGTAAGKTTLTRGILGEDPNRVNIDSDANKLQVPEYAGLKKSNPKRAAALVHDESKAISKRVIQEATKNGLDFIYDTSTGGGGEKLFQKLKDLGYRVRLVYADIPTEEAVDRATKRAKESTDPINKGRVVPDDVVRKKHVEAARAFRTFIDSPYVDEIRAFDTTTREPKEFFSKDEKGETVHDQKIFDRAKEKANERIPGK